jgi:hypothetical protein
MGMRWTQNDLIWDYVALTPSGSKMAIFEADLNKIGFFGGLMGHPSKISLFLCMPAVIRAY